MSQTEKPANQPLPTAFDRALLDKTGDIKAALLSYARENFTDVLKSKMDKAYGARALTGLSRDERMRFIDGFITQDLLPPEQGGNWVIDRFLSEDAYGQSLSPEEKEVVLNWRDNVAEGFFEIRQFDPKAEALRLYNLIDETEYITRSNADIQQFKNFPVGTFILTRLLPIKDYWIFSGPQNLIGAKERRMVQLEAARLVRRTPSLAFHNLQKLEEAWKIQKRERAAFIAHFGSDMVVLQGSDLKAKMEQYFRYRLYEWNGTGSDLAEDNLTALERFQQLNPGQTPPIPALDFPASLLAADTVGVIYDEIEGLNYFLDFAVFEQAFRQPNLLDKQDSLPYQVVQGYLLEESISALPFVRMIIRHKPNAGIVLAKIVGAKYFDVDSEFRQLLLQFKPEHVLHKKYPSVTMLPDSLKRAEEEAEALAARLQNLKGTNSNWKRPPKSPKGNKAKNRK